MQNELLLIFKLKIARLIVTFGKSAARIHRKTFKKLENGVLVEVPLVVAVVWTISWMKANTMSTKEIIPKVRARTTKPIISDLNKKDQM